MSEVPDKPQAITSRIHVVTQIEQRLGGHVSDSALARWAFDRFYAEELEAEHYEPGYEAAIADALDALMFNDEPGFALRDDELRALITKLQSQ